MLRWRAVPNPERRRHARDSLHDLSTRLLAFARARDRAVPFTENLSMALAVRPGTAGTLPMAQRAQSATLDDAKKDEVALEMADILIYLVRAWPSDSMSTWWMPPTARSRSTSHAIRKSACAATPARRGIRIAGIARGPGSVAAKPQEVLAVHEAETLAQFEPSRLHLRDHLVLAATHYDRGPRGCWSPGTRLKSITTSSPPGLSAAWMLCSMDCGYSNDGRCR